MPQTIPVGSRSLFVTTIAWVFIVLGLVAVASALVQQATLVSMRPGLDLPGGVAASALTGWLMRDLPWVLGAVLAVSGAMLVSAIGLLLRLEWARRVFIGVLVLAIAANLAGLWLQHELVQSLVSASLWRGVAGGLEAVGSVATAAQAVGAAVTLGACGVLAWIIRALMSPRVRQAFA